MQGIDRTLLDRCIRKESAAQFALFKCLHDTLMSVARRYERDNGLQHAMMNAAFLKILDNLHQWRNEAPFGAWCHRIMVNTALNELRAHARTQPPMLRIEDTGAEARSEVDVNAVEETMAAEELQCMLDRVPPVSRQVFNLHVVDGWMHKEIAEALDITEGTSKWHVNHARQILRKQLTAHLATRKTTRTA